MGRWMATPPCWPIRANAEVGSIREHGLAYATPFDVGHGRWRRGGRKDRHMTHGGRGTMPRRRSGRIRAPMVDSCSVAAAASGRRTSSSSNAEWHRAGRRGADRKCLEGGGSSCDGARLQRDVPWSQRSGGSGCERGCFAGGGRDRRRRRRDCSGLRSTMEESVTMGRLWIGRLMSDATLTVRRMISRVMRLTEKG